MTPIAEPEKLVGGVPGLDLITHGGIPKGRTTLITGKSGAGKSVLAVQLASHLASTGHVTAYLAVEERPNDLVLTGDAFGFGVSELVARGALELVDIRRPVEGPTIVTGEYDVEGLIARIDGIVHRLGATVVVLDSISALFNPRPPESIVRTLVFFLVNALEDRGLTVILTAEAPADYSRPTVLGAEDYVCDLVLVLRNVVDGKRRRRTIEVHKYRRSGHFKGEYPCTIANTGVVVFPLDALTASEHPVHAATERFSSGMRGLDEMNAGGWMRDSIVLVRGPSGSGKTMLAGMYARAGASRGEKVVYYGFEETRGILLRNFEAIGMPLESLESDGHIVVTCRYPEATSPEDLLIEFRRDLDEIEPSLIVLDSISSIEHSCSPEGFRTFLIGLAALLRERGRSALLTQAISSQSEANPDPPYLSTVADAIVMLDYSANAPELERTMRILKMRGSAHTTGQRRLVIGAGGLTIEPLPGAP